MADDYSTSDIDLCAENYVEILAGGEVLEALKLHTRKAGVNTRYILWDGSSIAVCVRVFQAARAQNKLQGLLDVIREEFPNVNFEGSPFPPSIQEAELEAETAILKYREWVKSETEYVDIRGIGRRRAEDAIVFPILELYTELFVQTGLSNLDMEKGYIRGGQRIPLSEMVEATRLLVVMGDPGAGKTTFLRFIARQYSEKTVAPLPIYFRLADVYDYALEQQIRLDADIFTEYFVHNCQRYHIGVTADVFDDLVSVGRCIWLLDSLDELSSNDKRVAMVKAIEDAARRWSQCKFVLTSRPLPLKGKAIPLGFERVGIENWNRDDIRSFLEAWTKLLMPKASSDKRNRYWGGLLATILDRQDLRTLAKNAVMVTAMAVVHHNETRLPEGRAELLESLVYWLVRARNRPGDLPSSQYNFIESRYRELALAMFEAEGGRRRRVGRLWAAERLANSFGDDVDAALEFLGKEETNTGVLVRRGEGDLEFWHLSFQEYLAAVEIAGKTDDLSTGWWPRIRDRLDETEWREVLIFVPLCLNRLGSERVDLFFERLAESCANADLLTKARRAALGASIQRDLGLSGYKAARNSLWNKIVGDMAQLFTPLGKHIPLEMRYEAAIAYGLGGDERLRNFETTWIPLNGGAFYLGAQNQSPMSPNYDLLAAPWEGPAVSITLNDFDIRKYPITVEEYASFVNDDGYHLEDYWGQDGWIWLTESGHDSPLDWEEQLLSPNCPITGVSWFEANAYCRWLTLGDPRDVVYRLPSESEWEYAAVRRLSPGTHFPWGNEITPGELAEANCAWTGLRKKTPIGLFPKSTTADGIVDLFGNVEEWCLDSWHPDHSRKAGDGSAIFDEDTDEHVVRGGSTIRFMRLCRPTYRSKIVKSQRYHPVGFRPVRIWQVTVSSVTN